MVEFEHGDNYDGGRFQWIGYPFRCKQHQELAIDLQMNASFRT